MILVVDSAALLDLIRRLPGGWNNLQVRPLDNNQFNVSLSKKQIQALGMTAIKEVYE